MRGIVFLGNRKLEIQEFPDPTPGPGEVVLEMKASGMCGSDLHPYRAAGNAAAALGLGAGGPVIAGHEPCGVVAAVGVGVDHALVGQRVMNHHYKGCGDCRHCRDRKSTRLNSSHVESSYAVFCLKKKKKTKNILLLEKKNKKKQKQKTQ